MKTGSRRGVVLATTLLGAFTIGCGAGEEQPCSETNPCVPGMACDRTASCVPADPLGLLETRLADGVRGADYADTLHAEGGLAPYTLELGAAPAWLTLRPGEVDGEAELGGVPDELCADRLVEVVLTDSSFGQGQRVTVELSLTVTECGTGDTRACAYAEGGRCLLGESACLQGDWGACAGGQASADPARCGPDCGACGPEADSCRSGLCACGAWPVCVTGEACCDGGCRVLASDAAHCGGCGRDCAIRLEQVATPACRQGACDYDACAQGHLDCDGDRSNGCETPFSAADCGACGFSCGEFGACVDGACGCLTPHDDCDGSLQNGCEAYLPTALEHCGLCSRSCLDDVVHAAGIACAGGECDYASCLASHADCDGERANGCEQGLWETQACGPGCGGLLDCHLHTVHAEGVSCDRGTCTYEACQPGYKSCDDDPADGCETLLWNPENCRTDCLLPGVDCRLEVQHAIQLLCDGACDYTTCDSAFGDCDENRRNGCEQFLWAPDSCGQGCEGRVDCHLQVEGAGTATCVDGACDYDHCEANRGDCDFDRTNGCETFLLSDPDHCNACFFQCPNHFDYCCAGLCSMDPC